MSETLPAVIPGASDTVTQVALAPDILKKVVLLGGDCTRLSPEEKMQYYIAMCGHLGLNPITKPFDYISLDGKLVLYPRKDCTEQLRKQHNISIEIVSAGEVANGKAYVVRVKASMPSLDGVRYDEATGSVSLVNKDDEPLTGNYLANTLMRAETKAKRRVTLSICGLGMFDESEIETIRGAKKVGPAKPEQIGRLALLPPEVLTVHLNDYGVKHPSQLTEEQANVVLAFVE